MKLTKFSHESDPWLAGNLVDGVQSAYISLLQLRHLPPTEPQIQENAHTALKDISTGACSTKDHSCNGLKVCQSLSITVISLARC